VNVVISDVAQFYHNFPCLNKMPRPFRETSPADVRYNCFAWAFGVTAQWWDPRHIWPEGCPRELSIKAFMETFGALGYEPCGDGRRQKGWEKIALYAKGDEPTHAARQLTSGRWTSKLGKNIDIEHRVRDLEGPCYGKVVAYFSRRTQG
jgi:hypothetical protein